MKYIKPAEINFPKLEQVCTIWARRYSLKKITFYQTIDSLKPYFLFIENFQPETKFMASVGQIGLRSTGSAEEKEFLECLVCGDPQEFLKKWSIVSRHVLTFKNDEGTQIEKIEYTNYDYWNGYKFFTDSEMNELKFEGSEIVLFNDDTNLYSKNSGKKNINGPQQDKENCQQIAESVWKKNPELASK